MGGILLLFHCKLYLVAESNEVLQKFCHPLRVRNCKIHSTIRKTLDQENKLLTSLTFLLRYREYNTIPRFSRLHHHIHFPADNRIYQNTSFALLRERIHQNRRELDNISRELLKIHLRLARVLFKSNWSLIDQLTFKKAARVGEESKGRQLRRFARPHKTQHPNIKTSKETVMNHSGQTLDDGVSSLVQKVLNYAVTPRTITTEKIFVGVEKAVQSLPVEMAEEARQDTVRIHRQINES
jgi:hypothetical protein